MQHAELCSSVQPSYRLQIIRAPSGSTLRVCAAVLDLLPAALPPEPALHPCLYIDAAAKRAFVGAGITTWGEQAAALCTFWNVGAANGRPLMVIPGWDSGPLWNYIGVNLDPAAVNNIGKLLDPVIPKGMNWVMEPLPAQRKLVPAELYTSMLQQRLSQQAGSNPLEQPS